jgi:hypothetical protein
MLRTLIFSGAFFERPLAGEVLMTPILIAMFGGVLSAGIALLAFSARATKDMGEIERKYYEAKAKRILRLDGAHKRAFELSSRVALR